MNEGSETGAVGAPAPAESVTVVLADDHRIVRAGLRLLLDAQAGLHVVAEARDVPEAGRVVAAHRPQVLVLDVDMPGGSALAAIGSIAEQSPQTRIVMLTMHTDPELAREALHAGATGYVLKESAESELVDAIHAAAAGRTYVAPSLGARLAVGSDRARPSPGDVLSGRERQVLALIALGHTNGEIATQLYLSVRTVESHRARIQQKTGRGSRAQLVAYARERGIA